MSMQVALLMILILCCSNAGDISKAMLYFYIFTIVMSFCMVHFRDRTSLIPKYVYGLFCERMGSCLYLVFWAFRYVVNARGCSFDFLGHPMNVHLFMPSSKCT